MTQDEIQAFITALPHVEHEEQMGYLFFFVGAYHLIPFVSIAQTDNEYDRASRLDREGVFRINIGVSKETFQSLFPTSDQEQTFDYSALDVFMPHPDYAKQFFICILCPSEKNEAVTKEYIIEAHGLAEKMHSLRKKNEEI